MQVAIVLGVALIVVALILHKDLTTGTDEKTTVPIVTEVTEDKDEVTQINEPLFTMELPVDWEQVNRVQAHYANFYEWRSTKQGEDNRRLLLHIDILPSSYKITRVQPLIVNENKFNLGNISENCANFAKDTQAFNRTTNAPVEAKWENILFMCDPVEANQTVGTGTAEGGIAARVGEHNYFFYYEDHNIRPNDKILQDALRSFRAR